jgi:starvation-inducible DNA-binding protein
MMMRSPSPLPDKVRQQSGEKINAAAIDLAGLALVVRKAHWNVRGPLFGQLHGLFGEIYNAANDHTDKLAEHVAMLGLVVRGDHVEVAADAVADPLPDETDGLALAELVFDRIQATLVELAEAQKEVQALKNEDGFQLLLDASIGLSKLGWMIGAYIEGPETERVRKTEPPKKSNDESPESE